MRRSLSIPRLEIRRKARRAYRTRPSALKPATPRTSRQCGKKSWIGMRHAAPVRRFCLPLDIEVLTHSHRSSVPPPAPAAYDGLAWRALTLRRRRGTLSGKYSDHSLYVAPSNFDGVQPGRVSKYAGQVRSAKACVQRTASSLDYCQAAHRAAWAFPSSLQVAPASFVRARSASLGDLADHDANECQGLFPPLKYDSSYSINSSRMDVTGSGSACSAYICRSGKSPVKSASTTSRNPAVLGRHERRHERPSLAITGTPMVYGTDKLRISKLRQYSGLSSAQIMRLRGALIAGRAVGGLPSTDHYANSVLDKSDISWTPQLLARSSTPRCPRDVVMNARKTQHSSDSGIEHPSRHDRADLRSRRLVPAPLQGTPASARVMRCGVGICPYARWRFDMARAVTTCLMAGSIRLRRQDVYVARAGTDAVRYCGTTSAR
ncbi:hypothetical protein VTO73DRAFT_14544 [Trametes versicolor]